MPRFLKLFFYFLFGAVSCTLILISLSYLIFTAVYKDKLYPGVTMSVAKISPDLVINLTSPRASVSAKASEINLHPDRELMTKRAFSIGRQTKNPYYNFLQILAAWQGKIILPVELALDAETLNKKIDAMAPQIEKKTVDAVFKFQPDAGPDRKGRVIAFTPSENGLIIDREKIKQEIISQAKSQTPKIVVPLYTRVIVPTIQTTTADQMGVKNLLGRGESYFYDSIPGRIYNIKLGTEKVSGSLIPPGEIFSFNDSIGTISALFGFQKAYAIIRGKTVLDDGGGVCQVSTTLYRAALNSGLPIVERTAHTYRVGFYEQGGYLPGLDATVYPPSPDFKFKNDTNSYLLIQAAFDPEHTRLTFELFGKSDGRQTEILGPYILSTSPSPDPVYEDDPSLPAGLVKQVDTAHPGAEVYFKRNVVRDNQLLISEIVRSSFIPWPARFLKGTKT